MSLRRFTDFILERRWNAAGVAFIFAFIPIINSISILIAALVVLRKGAFEGALVVCAATLPYIISSYAMPVEAGMADIAMIALAVVIVSNLLTWLFALILRQYGYWNFTLEVALIVGVLFVAGVHLAYPTIQEWWQAQLITYFSKTVTMLSADTVPDAAQVQMATVMKTYATGLVAASILFNALLQLVLARWWQSVMYRPGGLRQELSYIRLNYVAGALFVIAFFLSSLNNATMRDSMPVFYAIFSVAGMSLIHGLLKTVKSRWILLILIYIGLIALLPASIVILSVAAWLDIGMDFRKRFVK